MERVKKLSVDADKNKNKFQILDLFIEMFANKLIINLI